MSKRKILTLFLVFPMLSFVGAENEKLPVYARYPESDNEMVSSYSRLSSQQLLDTADYFYQQNSFDTALMCYNLLISITPKNTPSEQQKNVAEALNKSAIIYSYLCDYRKAYDLLLKALILCEKFDLIPIKSRIYNNLGNIYYNFDRYNIAKRYYSDALNLCQDSTIIIVILNNLSSVEMEVGRIDSAVYFIQQSYQISKQLNNLHLHTIFSTTAQIYQKDKRYALAHEYLHLALNEAKKNNKPEYAAQNLTGLGKLFFEINQVDSALYYTDLSNKMAAQHHFLDILAENYLLLFQIEEANKRYFNALKYHKTYADLKDSIFNAERFGDIHQLQRMYEISKTNQQIEELAVEQQAKEYTIHSQRITLLVVGLILLTVCVILRVVFIQKRKLNAAYKILVEKNIEIIDFQNISNQTAQEKHRKGTIAPDVQDELLSKILIIMEDKSVFCDNEFSVTKLAELVQSNQTYVSQAINHTLKKNFRSFLNEYRIREAQQLFLIPETSRYTIESVALQVGFKSRSAFRNAFKEITGVTPDFYLKSI